MVQLLNGNICAVFGQPHDFFENGLLHFCFAKIIVKNVIIPYLSASGVPAPGAALFLLKVPYISLIETFAINPITRPAHCNTLGNGTGRDKVHLSVIFL